MKLWRKYLLAEMAAPFLLGLCAFTLVVFLQRFTRLTDLVIARDVPIKLVGSLILSMFPLFLEITLPASLLLGIMLALGRFAADSETTALSGAGIGMRSVAVPVLIACLIAFSASLLVAWKGIAWANRESQRVLAQILAERAGAGASEHVFREIAPDVVIYPDQVSSDGRRMEGVFLSFRPPSGKPLFVFAREGRFLEAGEKESAGIELLDGTIHGDQSAVKAYRVASFGKMVFHVPVQTTEVTIANEPKGMTLPQLAEKIRETGGVGQGVTHRYHFHRRLSVTFSCISFGLLAIPLGMSQRARGKSSSFGKTFALILIFYLFIAGAGILEKDAPRTMVAVFWTPNVLGILLAAWILCRSEQSADLFPTWFRKRGTFKT
ncbi:MAG: LptF/LptG family permease [Syntrophorhabdaceae bacterium]|nr:LptF/LptG family permease [Syntrophorhabdaceae bacterium]